MWSYAYDPLGRRLKKERLLSEAERAWVARRFPQLAANGSGVDRGAYYLGEKPPKGASPTDERPPIVGTAYSWDGDVIAEEAPLRLDGSIEWEQATRWHFEPGTFKPLAKEEAPDSTPQEQGSQFWVKEKLGERQLLYIVTDHLGTPREMFDERGDLQWAASYSTWGLVRGVKKAVPQPANDDGLLPSHPGPRTSFGNLALKPVPEDSQQAYACPIRFQGQWQDEETGLYYNRHRHYDPLAAQYISPDPIGLEGGERPQGYVTKPTIWVDPLALAQTTTLYRAVSPAEAQSIRQTGQFRPSPTGLEHKYFSSTEAGARQYGEMAKAFGENQTIIVRTTIPTKSITPEMKVTVDRGISTVAVPNEMLPSLKPEFMDGIK